MIQALWTGIAMLCVSKINQKNGDDDDDDNDDDDEDDHDYDKQPLQPSGSGAKLRVSLGHFA